MAGPDLSRMSEQEAIAALRQYYANAGPLTAQPRDSTFQQDPQFSQGVMPSYGNDKLSGFRPDGDGYFGNLTAPFDPLNPGGRYGSYQGRFSADGTLDPASVGFSPEERSGSFVSENMLPITLAVMAGTSLYNGLGMPGSPGSSGAEWVSGADLPAGPMVGTDASGYGATMGTGGAGGGGGADVIGSDWAAGAPTGPTGGIAPPMPTTPPTLPGGGVGKWVMDNGKWIAAAAGTIAGAAGGGPDVSTTSRNVPEWAQPYAQNIVKAGEDIYRQPFQPYTGQRYAEPNDAMRTSWEMASQFARGGPSSAEQTARGTFDRLQGAQVPDFGKATQIDNKYIGNPTAVASNQYIGAAPTSNVSSLLSGGGNPIFGQTTGLLGPLKQMSLDQTTTNVGKNALLGMDNPFLNDQIKYATGDITRNFRDTINPNLDRMARASGSFGNSGVEQARQAAERTMAEQVGRTTSDMRMADYNLQAQLGEGDLTRRVNASLADATRNRDSSRFAQEFNINNDYNINKGNLDYRQADLLRNSNIFDKGQDRTLDAGKFDADSARLNWTSNLNATTDINKFNAGQANDAWLSNLNATTDINKFNAEQGNLNIKNGIDTWNSAEDRAARSLGSFTGFDDAELRRAGVLGATGKEMQTEAQRPLTASYEDFLRGQDDPYRRLSAYTGAYGAGVNGQSVQSTPTGNSPAANALGGAAAATGFYDLLMRPTASTTPTDTTQPRWFSDWLSTQRR